MFWVWQSRGNCSTDVRVRVPGRIKVSRDRIRAMVRVRGSARVRVSVGS